MRRAKKRRERERQDERETSGRSSKDGMECEKSHCDEKRVLYGVKCE